jgi:lipopolysaccharide/colanic/teichoic acid biosynthesis glycosyltransferase
MNVFIKLPQFVLRAGLDFFVSVICLILSSPVMIILALLIKFSGDGPVIYKQKRIGRFGKPFIIYKFRSMRTGTEEGIPLLSGPNDKRVTRVGAFMRKYKLDELPNFVNVLKGEMSLVGPRPEQQYFINQILLRAPRYKLLHNIKPGVTSWGQVNYGYASNVDEMLERLKYDLYYQENRSLWFDLKILVYTISVIYKGETVKNSSPAQVLDLAG